MSARRGSWMQAAGAACLVILLATASGCARSAARTPPDPAAAATAMDSGASGSQGPDEPRFVPIPREEIPSTPPSQADSQPGPYAVQVGDTLEVSVYGDPEMTRQVPVRPDGMISYTFVGDVQAAGRGIQEIRDELQDRLGVFLRSPEVTVIATDFGKPKVYIGGEVKQPGVFYMEPRENTLLDVVYRAGLTTERADVRNAVLVRDGRIIDVDFTGLLRGDLSGNVKVRDNDLVYIPEAAERYIYVLGEVRSPRAVETTIPLSFVNVLAQAGGMQPAFSDVKEVAVLRGGLKEPKVAVINFKRLIDGDFSQNIMIRPGDIVFIPTTALGKYTRVVEQILRTFSLLFQGRLVSEGFQ